MSYDFIVKAPQDQHERFDYNVTYNLGSMLKRAGFHPLVVAGMNVSQLRPVVTDVLCVMRDNPDYFKQLNPPIDPDTGKRWGDYDRAVTFLTELLRYLTDAPENYIMMVV